MRGINRRKVDVSSVLRGAGLPWVSIADYRVGRVNHPTLPPAVTRKLAVVPTRLDAMPEDLQEKLVNGGYEICDTGLRAYVDKEADRDRLPCPDHPNIDA